MLNYVHTMAYKQHRSTAACEMLHAIDTSALKRGISHRQYFINNQNLRLQMCRDGECQPHVHPAAVALDRRVEKVFDVSEGDNLIELAGDFAAAHAEDRAVHIDVFTTG